MKRLLAFSVLLTFSLQGLSQVYWAKAQAGLNVDETIDVVSDENGNSFSIGYFSTSADINGVTTFVEGLTDIFVSRVTQNGSTQWVQTFGGIQSDRGLGIAVDDFGSVFICGFYTGSIDFGNGVVLNSIGGQDAFVAKLQSNGAVLWARTAGSTGNSDRANAVAADPSGNVVITGQFTGEAQFGTFSLNATDGTTDVFIAKYDPDGNELWVKQGTGDDLDRGLSVATDNEGGVYTTGQFSGDISFDNTYTNTIQNAIFIIKHSANGDEEWFRWGGGTEQSIGSDLTTDGSSVYLTGDYGAALSFFGASQVDLSSGFPHSFFILSISSSGNFNWDTSVGSESNVSSRSIDFRGSELGVAGSFECQLDEFSEQYGDATFRSIGFKDAFCAVFTSNGSFEWARNFGSRGDVECTAISLLPDGVPLLAGVNSNDDVIIPVEGIAVSGLSDDLLPQQNLGITHCNDPFYGNFRTFSSSGVLDGFLLKVLTPDRSPFDFYQRSSGACNTDVPNSCIFPATSSISDICQDQIIDCSGYFVGATNYVIPEIGFEYDYAWASNGSTAELNQIAGQMNEQVTLTSIDNCFSSQDDAALDVYPPIEIPLITDSEGVNNMSQNPLPIVVCPGETVDITADVPDGYTFQWSGGQFGSEPVIAETISNVEPGSYFLSFTSPEGCFDFLIVSVDLIEVPQDVPPVISFLDQEVDDTIQVCAGENVNMMLLNALTLEEYPVSQYDITWSSIPDVMNGAGLNASILANSSGWYEISSVLESVENECIDEVFNQVAVDSIYIEVLPVPELFVELEGPQFWCPGDTISLDVSFSGSLTLDFDPIAIIENSILVQGAGTYIVSADSTNAFGCTTQVSDALNVLDVVSPQINALPEDAVICPGESVTLITNSPGDIQWQGPEVNGFSSSSINVDQPGQYFAEVEFYEGCALVSNTIEVVEFSTPFLTLSNPVLCADGMVELTVVSSSFAEINWLPPLFGDVQVQEISQPGIYQVEVTACEILTSLEVEISLPNTDISIALTDSTPRCEGDSIAIAAFSESGVVSYEWFPSGNSPMENFQEGGSVFVQVVDSFGCEWTSNVLEIAFEAIPPPPTFVFDPFCEGEATALSVETAFQPNFIDIETGTVWSTADSIEIESLDVDSTFYAFLSSEFCTGPLDSVTLVPIPFPEPPIPATDAPVCTGTSVRLEVLNSASEGVNYVWSTPSGNSLFGADVLYGVADLSEEGEYTVYSDRMGCLSDTASIQVSLFETKQVELPLDTALCFIPDFVVTADTIYASYSWNYGVNDSIFVTDPNTSLVSITVTDFNGCRSSDEMIIDFADCSIPVPNIFTPNGDDRNDTWFISLDRPGFFDLAIYNRWGRTVYESKDHTKGWNGNHYKTDEPCSEGVYFYILRVNDFENKPFDQQGNLTLIRE